MGRERLDSRIVWLVLPQERKVHHHSCVVVDGFGLVRLDRRRVVDLLMGGFGGLRRDGHC